MQPKTKERKPLKKKKGKNKTRKQLFGKSFSRE
jgi:hypothetical protein